jgi:very-short-patch-repair endonuclease
MTADPLPLGMGSRPFSIHDAQAAGVGPSRLRAKDLSSPFSGVRAPDAPTTVQALALAYLPKLALGEFFSHATAALLHMMWLPLWLERELVLHVSVRKPLRAPRDRRVKGHHVIDRPGLVRTVGGLPVANPWETWAQLAWLLTEEELVVAGEALLSKGRPHVRQMLERLVAVAGDSDRHFHAKLMSAAAQLRIGSRSAAETRFRLFLVRNGLPEPEINVRILDAQGRFVAESDLVYRRERVLIEYEGDGHRERRQFREDITRVEKLQDEAWHVIRVTEDDAKRDPQDTIARIRRALERRRPDS